MIDRPPWEKHRRVMWAWLIFSAIVILWLISAGEDSELNRAIAWSVLWIDATIILGYLGIATIDDLNVMKHLGRDAYERRPSRRGEGEA
ncbi:MAG: hypothetical protein ACXIVF_15315 [Rhizobiaceae bacterium]